MSAADELGWRVMRAGLERAKAVFAERLVAAYALGSLAHGGFSPEVSDVDLALVTSELDATTEARMNDLKADVARELGTPLAARLSLFWSTFASLATDAPKGRFPLVDRIDLAAHGVLLHGEDRREELRLPRGEARRAILIVEGAELALKKLATAEQEALCNDPARLVALGVREVTKAVLFPARFLATLDLGEPAGNEVAVKHYLARPTARAKALVEAAGRYRRAGLEPEAEALLRRELGPLRAELRELYRDELARLGRDDLSAAFEAWRRRASSDDSA